jgi:ABC-type multidrug transport system fused ATPase/permease subunit
MILNAFFTSITPYFNIYMSAEVVNNITANRSVKSVMTCVAITVFGNFIIRIASAILNRELERKMILFNQNEKVAFNKKILELDYENLENTEIRQLKRKITESEKVNGYGKQKLVNSLNNLVLDIINILIAVAFFFELFFDIFTTSYDWTGILILVIMIVLIVMNVVANFHEKNKMAHITDRITRTMIEENRIESAIDCYNMGKDIRLYSQDKLITNILSKNLHIHKNAFRDVFKEKFKEGIALQVLSYVLQFITYAVVCFYATQKVLGVGSVIKYIGLTEKLIKSIISIFADCSDIKSNTSFIEEYLMFFNIPQKMKSGIKSFEVNTIDFSECEIDEYSCAMKSHFRKSGNQMTGRRKSSNVSLLA